MGSIQNQIETKLRAELNPAHLEVVNESHKHEGHAHMGPETHFMVIAVSQRFEGLRAVERHRLVHGILAELLKETIHALTLRLYSPGETR